MVFIKCIDGLKFYFLQLSISSIIKLYYKIGVLNNGQFMQANN